MSITGRESNSQAMAKTSYNDLTTIFKPFLSSIETQRQEDAIKTFDYKSLMSSGTSTQCGSELWTHTHTNTHTKAKICAVTCKKKLFTSSFEFNVHLFLIFGKSLFCFSLWTFSDCSLQFLISVTNYKTKTRVKIGALLGLLGHVM